MSWVEWERSAREITRRRILQVPRKRLHLLPSRKVDDLKGLEVYFRVLPTAILQRSITLGETDGVRLERMQVVRVAVLREIRLRKRVNRVGGALDAWSALLPSRISTEVLGDYIEDINRRVAAGQGFIVWLRVLAAIFWTAINAIGYALRQLGRTKSGA